MARYHNTPSEWTSVSGPVTHRSRRLCGGRKPAKLACRLSHLAIAAGSLSASARPGRPAKASSRDSTGVLSPRASQRHRSAGLGIAPSDGGGAARSGRGLWHQGCFSVRRSVFARLATGRAVCHAVARDHQAVHRPGPDLGIEASGAGHCPHQIGGHKRQADPGGVSGRHDEGAARPPQRVCSPQAGADQHGRNRKARYPNH